jgi:hypothetical protein
VVRLVVRYAPLRAPRHTGSAGESQPERTNLTDSNYPSS